ncbi:MAG: SUR7/PalI family-domain-containing protein [Benjaminiella poitrasii]|nr:MAG: SUR7/PalI family-domain-containing protein [Benjaminiella poitrasii]
MWCFPTFTTLGSLFLLFSFLLELFIIIGQLSNRNFINKIYYVKAWNNQGQSYNLGLWNYCTGGANDAVTGCSSPHPAYNWAQTPNIIDAVPNMANSFRAKSLFLGLFILVFIALGFSFIFWLMSFPICCLRRRSLGHSMSTFAFINFLIMLVALILALVLVLSGIRSLTGGTSTWQAHAGNALWIHIGAVVSLFLAFLCYSGGSCFGRGGTYNRKYHDDVEDNTTTRGKWFFGRRGNRNNKIQAEPINKYTVNDGNYHTGYTNQVPLGTAGSQHAQMTSPGFQHATTAYSPHTNDNVGVLQQPYALSPNLEHQRQSVPANGIASTLSNNDLQPQYTGYDHQPYNNLTGTSNVIAHDANNPGSIHGGYQTPVLQPANTIH